MLIIWNIDEKSNFKVEVGREIEQHRVIIHPFERVCGIVSSAAIVIVLLYVLGHLILTFADEWRHAFGRVPLLSSSGGMGRTAVSSTNS